MAINHNDRGIDKKKKNKQTRRSGYVFLYTVLYLKAGRKSSDLR